MQGLIAGINAAMKLLGREPLILDRSEAYIGVLIDDLVTKESHEPYRMMTSRAEYRLLLRQDNADLRLSAKGHEIGLISDERMEKVEEKRRAIAEEIKRLSSVMIARHNSTALNNGVSLADLIKRPELDYETIAELDKDRKPLPWDVIEQINITIKYKGYIDRQNQQVHQFKKLESRRLPDDIDYEQIKNLRLEARQKLKSFRPRSIGQASRISGVSPADVTVLLVYLESRR